MTNPYLSVVIPAYNEAQRIGRTLERIQEYLLAQDFSAEIVVVLDGGTDNTAQVVNDFAAELPIKLIDRKENRGKGYTVREGMLAATGAVRLFTDADNATDIGHFDKMKTFWEQGKHVVIASRDSKDSEGEWQAVPQSFKKRVMGNLGNLFIQLVAVPGIWDTQCGFKGFSAEATQKIFPQLEADGFTLDVEALALARKYGYDVSIVPAHWINDDRSKVKPIDYVKVLLGTLKIRWNLIRGRYQ